MKGGYLEFVVLGLVMIVMGVVLAMSFGGMVVQALGYDTMVWVGNAGAVGGWLLAVFLVGGGAIRLIWPGFFN